jgi:hydroxymethylpyrimidine pyrophosphatase-like HAD family hydrolase
LIIAVDFDGTCVKHSYPQIGEDIGAVPVLKELSEKGHKLILFTMRSGSTLQAAVDWFRDKGIPLYGINSNPTQHTWTSSPKPYAHLYIDDMALGCPLIREEGFNNPYVDWVTVRENLVWRGLL